jgi:hypothetical protein
LNNNYFNKEEEYNYRNDINHPLTRRAFELFEEMEGTYLFPVRIHSMTSSDPCAQSCVSSPT